MITFWIAFFLFAWTCYSAERAVDRGWYGKATRRVLVCLFYIGLMVVSYRGFQ